MISGQSLIRKKIIHLHKNIGGKANEMNISFGVGGAADDNSAKE
jgi:hypothetical protein